MSPADLSAEALLILRGQPGATNLVHLPGVAVEPAGDLIQADVARECVEELVSGLRGLGVDERGSIGWRAVDTAIGADMRRAGHDAPIHQRLPPTTITPRGSSRWLTERSGSRFISSAPTSSMPLCGRHAPSAAGQAFQELEVSTADACRVTHPVDGD